MPTPRYDMAGILILRHTQVGWQHLQLFRSPGRYMGNTWSLCRGGCLPGETSLQAALREMREETLLIPMELYRLSTLEQFYTETTDTIWHAPFFAAIVAPDAEPTLNEEHTAYRWVPDAEITTHLTWPGEQKLIAETQTYLLGNHPTKSLMQIQLP